MWERIVRIVTHTDFDGICCAALFLRKYGSDIEIIYTTVKEAKRLSRTNFSADYTCDLPKVGDSINIDHHKSNYEELRETNRLEGKDLVNPNAASATDLVFTFLQFEDDPIAEEIRKLGHLADTAQLPDEYHPLAIVLTMNSENPSVLNQISQKLADKGRGILASKWLREKYQEVSDEYDETRKKINDFLENTQSLPRILILDTRQVIHHALAKEVFQPLFERNVAVVALIYSKSSQEPVRVSFRVTKSEQTFYDVSIVAKALGGGGHSMAAACSLKNEEIPNSLIQELEGIVKPSDTLKYIHL
jgi:hypothetical protein